MSQPVKFKSVLETQFISFSVYHTVQSEPEFTVDYTEANLEVSH